MLKERNYNKDFIKKVFTGEKHLFRLCEVNWITVPIYEELSVTKVLDMIKDDDHIKSFFPDDFFTKKRPEREYFYNIINTVYEDFLPPLINHAS